MRVLLTGVSGFFGAHMLEHLLEETDWEIVGIASWKHRGKPERVEEVLNDETRHRVTIITHDLNAPLSDKTKERIGHIDYIINAASDSHVDRSIDDPVSFVENNISLVLNMLEYARDVKPKKFIQFSTDEVYGPASSDERHPEWSTILPSNPYSASKAAQEAIAFSYWRTYGLPLIITNTMNMFGEMQDAEKYTAQLIKKVYRGEEVTVHGSENNIGSRFYLHARNCADAILFILRNIEPIQFSDSELYPQRFNVVGDVELNNLELAEMVAQVLEKPLVYHFEDFHKTRPGHDRRYALDGSKLKDAGWEAPMDFEQSLIKYINWTLKHPLWL
jgi:dTDP-glucose 4,6-dehydratase